MSQREGIDYYWEETRLNPKQVQKRRVYLCSRGVRRVWNEAASVAILNDVSLYSTSFSIPSSELIGSWRALIKGDGHVYRHSDAH